MLIYLRRTDHSTVQWQRRVLHQFHSVFFTGDQFFGLCPITRCWCPYFMMELLPLQYFLRGKFSLNGVLTRTEVLVDKGLMCSRQGRSVKDVWWPVLLPSRSSHNRSFSSLSGYLKVKCMIERQSGKPGIVLRSCVLTVGIVTEWLGSSQLEGYWRTSGSGYHWQYRSFNSPDFSAPSQFKQWQTLALFWFNAQPHRWHTLTKDIV